MTLTSLTEGPRADWRSAIAALQASLGEDIVQSAETADLDRHRKELLGDAPPPVDILAVAYPKSAGEVSQILKACSAAHIPVQPQGGLTGLAGGAVPIQPCLVLSLERMRAIQEIDRAASTMTVEAGAVLETVQKAADDAGFLFPLDLGARGSAQIGGLASTNAGGNRVLRYGMMRELVLGIEAVTMDGAVITSLNKMLKNNAGYDLKQLFVGSEGTLGVITRLVLRLYPKPVSTCTGLVAVKGYAEVLELLGRAKACFGPDLSAFEAMWPEFYHIGTTALSRQPPIAHGHGVYVLIETLGTDPAADQTTFEAVIGQAIGDGVVEDAVIAQSGKDSQAIWDIRDCPGQFPKVLWPQVSYDVSFPIGDLGGFVDDCRARLKARWPDIHALFFGHVADSNIHVSVKLDADITHHALDKVIYDCTRNWSGSVSAEHGIGTAKRAYLGYSRTPAEVALMGVLKRALDPQDLLNRGKVL